MAPRKIKVVDLVIDSNEETVCEKVEDEKQIASRHKMKNR